MKSNKHKFKPRVQTLIKYNYQSQLPKSNESPENNDKIVSYISKVIDGFYVRKQTKQELYGLLSNLVCTGSILGLNISKLVRYRHGTLYSFAPLKEFVASTLIKNLNDSDTKNLKALLEELNLHIKHYIESINEIKNQYSKFDKALIALFNMVVERISVNVNYQVKLEDHILKRNSFFYLLEIELNSCFDLKNKYFLERFIDKIQVVTNLLLGLYSVNQFSSQIPMSYVVNLSSYRIFPLNMNNLVSNFDNDIGFQLNREAIYFECATNKLKNHNALFKYNYNKARHEQFEVFTDLHSKDDMLEQYAYNCYVPRYIAWQLDDNNVTQEIIEALPDNVKNEILFVNNVSSLSNLEFRRFKLQ